MTQEERKAQEEKEKKQEKAMMWRNRFAFSVVFALGLFFFLPYFLSGIFHKVISSDNTLFLAGEGHGNCEKVRWTRRHPPMGRRGVSEYPRKREQVLKIEPPVRNGRADRSAVRRLFFFCRRAADRLFN